MRSSVRSAGVADTMCKLDIPRTVREATPLPMTPITAPAPPATPRAQLIHIETDRRLGHEWDEWDGKPLPNRGDFAAPARLFFGYAALTLAVALGMLAAVLYSGRGLLPERLLERGPFLRLMNVTSLVSRAFGRRDWVEHAAIDIYNTLAERRRRRVGKGELLVLIPRCLSKGALDGVLAIAGRYDVPVFVATRGQLARRVIRERRPRAVVAVACERDMMTGLRDVAGRLPVLGLTMRLPNGPCRDAMLDLDIMEEWVRGLVGA